MKKVRPIIKWTGGKYNEFPMFSQHLPEFENYYEPFFGGGGVFFALQPKGESFLNDKSTDLVNFYNLLHSAKFRAELTIYVNAWDEITNISAALLPHLISLYRSFINETQDAASVDAAIRKCLLEAISKNQSVLFEKAFIIDSARFSAKLTASVIDKCRRLKRIASQRARGFNDDELADHIETAFKSGFYLFLRDLTNQQFAGTLQMAIEKAAANWYFIREFCYASMFRFSKKGHFNIPYGGIAYNKKNFRQKVDNIFSNNVQLLFEKATFYNLDFEDFLNETQPKENDFIFLDPPYDSEFSEYDQNVFTKADQQRLRDTLFSAKAKWMMVIKETEFIRSLYESRKCTFIEFNKTYTYNVRGRNNRETKHLIIVSY